jgi:hypothetical protein
LDKPAPVRVTDFERACPVPNYSILSTMNAICVPRSSARLTTLRRAALSRISNTSVAGVRTRRGEAGPRAGSERPAARAGPGPYSRTAATPRTRATVFAFLCPCSAGDSRGGSRRWKETTNRSGTLNTPARTWKGRIRPACQGDPPGARRPTLGAAVHGERVRHWNPLPYRCAAGSAPARSPPGEPGWAWTDAARAAAPSSGTSEANAMPTRHRASTT